ncbi:MAG TPA: sugar phosphate isomerase [Armatimonadetes bacterium]|nr:sugar phosphate isomerase [Armatimonadota bacterium]
MTDRRGFLTGAAAVGAGLVAAGAARAQQTQEAEAARVAPTNVQLLLGSQEGRIPGDGLAQKAQRAKEFGFDGLELSPGIVGRVDEYKKILGDNGLGVAAICAADGPYIVPDEAQQRRAVDNAKRILDAAGELGSPGVIMVPAFNGAQDHLVGWEGRELLITLLRELGEHAVQAGSRMLLEPLNRGEARFLRQVGDAASICRDVGSPGVGVMGDFYHMRHEETSDMAAFIAGGEWLHHVHLASWSRNLPGQDDRSFVDGFRGLKWIGYSDYCSLECGVQGDPMVELPKSVEFLRAQWELA